MFRCNLSPSCRVLTRAIRASRIYSCWINSRTKTWSYLALNYADGAISMASTDEKCKLLQFSKSGNTKKVAMMPGRVSRLIKKGLPFGDDGNIDVARGQLLIAENVKPVNRALNTTSDFPLIIGDTARRALRTDYEAPPETLELLPCRTTAKGFLQQNGYSARRRCDNRKGQ